MKNAGTVISISSSDYTVERGGVNKVIFSHQLMMNAAGYDYVYIYPMTRITRKGSLYWHIIKNGKKIKQIFRTNDLIRYFENNVNDVTNLFLHHLMKIEISELSILINYYENIPCFYYIHDYYAICNQYNLLRNGETFCGIFERGENNCRSCSYFKSNAYDMENIRNFFTFHLNIIAIAPSDTAKNIWINSYPKMYERIQVISHQNLFGVNTKNMEFISHRKINVAFVGTCGKQKGWDDWLKIVEQIPEYISDNYKFWAFGNPKRHSKKIEYVRVNATNNVNAMIEQLRENKIDVVFLGSIWPETYAYTYYEAYASNAYILANRASGNIAKQVLERKNGILYESIDEVIDLITDIEQFKIILNNHKCSNNYGPEYLDENNQILQIMNTVPFKNGVGKKNFSVKVKNNIFICFFYNIVAIFDRTSLGRRVLLKLGEK